MQVALRKSSRLPIVELDSSGGSKAELGCDDIDIMTSFVIVGDSESANIDLFHKQAVWELIVTTRPDSDFVHVYSLIPSEAEWCSVTFVLMRRFTIPKIWVLAALPEVGEIG